MADEELIFMLTIVTIIFGVSVAILDAYVVIKHIIYKRFEFFFLTLMIMMPLSYFFNSLFLLISVIIFKDEVEQKASDRNFGDHKALHYLYWLPTMLYLNGAYAYLLRWVSYLYITNVSELIQVYNTLKQK